MGSLSESGGHGFPGMPAEGRGTGGTGGLCWFKFKLMQESAYWLPVGGQKCKVSLRGTPDSVSGIKCKPQKSVRF